MHLHFGTVKNLRFSFGSVSQGVTAKAWVRSI